MDYGSKLLNWIFFLSKRPLYTKTGNKLFNKIVVNTGAHQGCILFPILLSLYANYYMSVFYNNTIIKYADDTVIIGKLLEDDSRNIVTQVQKIVEWCKKNNLVLNVKKIKKLLLILGKTLSMF